MDRGPLEKEEAKKVKQAIAQNGQKRRRRRSSHSLSLSQSENSMTDGTANNPSPAVENLPEAFDRKSPTQGLSENSGRIEDLGSTLPSVNELASDMPTWSSQIPSISSSAADFAFPSPLFSPITLPDAQHEASETHALLDNFTFPSDILAGLGSSKDHQLPVVDYEGSDVQRPNYGLGLLACKESDSGSYMRVSASRSGLWPDSALNSYPHLSDERRNGPRQRILTTNEPTTESIALLSNYLTEISSIQFPFTQFTRNGREWLHYLLLRSQTVSDISLLLCKAYHDRGQVAENLYHRSNYDEVTSQVSVALKSLPSSTATLSLLDEEQKASQALFACAALLQAIYIDILYQETRQWKSCLTQAAAYVQVLINIIVRDDNINHPVSVCRLQKATAKAVLGHLVWCDILATVSCGRDPFLGINHAYLLDSEIISMAPVCGCHNWVVKALYDLASLQRWKLRAQEGKTLSVIQLAARASNLHECLVAAMAESSSAPGQVRPGQRGSFDSLVYGWVTDMDREITLLFARAAVIYLHVVVSGPNPHLPEIDTAVKESVGSIQTLAEKHLLQHVSWPLCVIACFAGVDERQSVQGFLREESKNTRKWFSTSHETLSIARECHRLRDQGQDCDWVASMESLDHRILLL
ncbi:fungal-specific transcription factor domain-containing protein [Aspergillus caelatus]|uniref:Fungal-specific transcription factor domain-containing protein n=1 Tax=Aspergillus caelatus TaxID=61420 RepID=A0A5N7AKI7_9EURO|nr:fungal-specific transcription factor domain-containing protein [Aspergillus caelatus]KAE8369716.1 fungal-specific transcription factor domain-containing protein [Aspergillus caelatus]